jgi:hypothetical protein
VNCSTKEKLWQVFFVYLYKLLPNFFQNFDYLALHKDYISKTKIPLADFYSKPYKNAQKAIKYRLLPTIKVNYTILLQNPTSTHQNRRNA